ncbi:MAG: UDP-N-acetylmuramate dehydrogenase [Nitrospirae bacterium]|nr:MAG: UDP-N-acetylmuramate dehydrogenase [Nitrospirota bacterium]
MIPQPGQSVPFRRRQQREGPYSMAQLTAVVSGVRGQVIFDAPLAEWTSLRIGGPADVLVVPDDQEDLIRLIGQAATLQVPVFVLGGTNVLVRDGGIRGVVISLAKCACIQEAPQHRLYAEAGVRLPVLMQYAAARALSGLEWAAGIPGTVGGAIVMNAGTHLGQMQDCVHAVQLLDAQGVVRVIPACDLAFSYRHVDLPDKAVILGAWLQLAPAPKKKIDAATKAYLQHRKATQPLTRPNAGSVFKNPPHMSAGRLIELAGLKGTRVGDAQVSQKHANFIINMGRARAVDAIVLIHKVQQAVFHQFGITLDLEWKIVGEGSS